MLKDCIQRSVEHARRLAAHGDDAAAKQVYLDVLRVDPAHYPALIEIGALAYASGHRSAARSAYAQVVQYHPGNAIGRVSLANLLFEDGDFSGARLHFEAALAVDPDFPEAHQGLARILTERGDAVAESHWQKGFVGHAIVTRRYRGAGPGIPLLLLVAARGGNIPTQQWIDDRVFAVTAIYADFHDSTLPLPPHMLVVNAIGDADLCGAALACAEELTAQSTAAVINQPTLVSMTGRANNAQRLAGVAGVIAPRITVVTRAALAAAEELAFPLLLRPPGFHTGMHFRYVADRDGLVSAAAELPGDELLAIEDISTRAVRTEWRANFGSCSSTVCLIHCTWRSLLIGRCITSPPLWRRMPRFARRSAAFSTIRRRCWAPVQWRRCAASWRRWVSITPALISRSRSTDRCCYSRRTRRW